MLVSKEDARKSKQDSKDTQYIIYYVEHTDSNSEELIDIVS